MKTPWGFIENNGKLVANSSVKDREHRAALGEAAIKLLKEYNITEHDLESLLEDEEVKSTPANLLQNLVSHSEI